MRTVQCPLCSQRVHLVGEENEGEPPALMIGPHFFEASLLDSDGTTKWRAVCSASGLGVERVWR